MPKDRSDVSYRVSFVPESGIDAQLYVIADEVVGSDTAADRAELELQRQYKDSDWLEVDAGYMEFVYQNSYELDRFRSGTTHCVALSVPYGVLVIG